MTVRCWALTFAIILGGCGASAGRRSLVGSVSKARTNSTMVTITLPAGETSSSVPGSPAPAAPSRTLADCGDWFAHDVAVLVCDPGVLSAAIRTGSVGSLAFAQISVPGRTTGGGDDVAQAIGTPMSAGELATIQLPSTGELMVFVHWRDSSGMERSAQQSFHDPAGREVVVRISPAAGPVFGGP